MQLEVTDELRDICRRILNEGSSVEDWESCTGDDYFESENFSGGFDEDGSGNAMFWFTCRQGANAESCFCLTPEDVHDILEGTLASVDLIVPPTVR